MSENNPRRLLAILGSPHQNGSTAAMLDCAVKAAVAAGWEVDQLWLYEKNIGYCNGCRACVALGNCVQRDDLQEIADLLRGCDVVALAAPAYWANVPALVKNLFDRLLGVAMEENGRLPKPRLSRNQRYLLLTACNTPFPFSRLFGQSSGALRAMNEFFHYSGMRPMGSVTFAGAGGSAELPGRVQRKIRRYWEK